MLEKMPGGVRGKLMLEEVPGKLCGKLMLEMQASVGHGNESCFRYFITHFSKIITCFNSRILLSCRDLCALMHLGEM